MNQYRLRTMIKRTGQRGMRDSVAIEAQFLGRWSGLLGKGWHNHATLTWIMRYSDTLADADRMARALRRYVRVHDCYPELDGFERKLLGLAR